MKQVRVNVEMKPDAVKKAVDKAAPKTLRSAGAYVRAIAMRSIPQRKSYKFSSAPGKPPVSHAGFKRTILFALTSAKKSVLVGPQYIKGGLTNTARTLEFGGRTKVKDFDVEHFNNGFKVGENGPYRADRVSKRDTVLRRTNVLDPKTKKRVVWIKLRSDRQAERATRLYRRVAKLLGKTKSIRFVARPYMRPALTRSLPKLSAFWKKAVN